MTMWSAAVTRSFHLHVDFSVVKFAIHSRNLLDVFKPPFLN